MGNKEAINMLRDTCREHFCTHNYYPKKLRLLVLSLIAGENEEMF